MSALGQPKAGLTPDMSPGLRPALGWPKAGLHFGKSGFENSKNAFFQKIKMVYAKSALTMLFGMLFLLQLCIGYLEKAFLAFKTKIQILRHPALGWPKAGWRWKSLFGKISNLDSEARNGFQYTKIEREVKNNNVYHCPGLEFQYNQLSFWTKPSKYAKMQWFIFF